MNYQKRTVVASLTGLTLEGMDIMFISFAMSMIIADFHIDLATGGLISSITNFGMLAGGVVFGIIADKFGRVRTLMLIGMLTFGQFIDRLEMKCSYGIFLLASASAVYLYSHASGSAAVLIGGAIVGFFSNGMFAGYGALISRFYPIQVRSTATNTIFNFFRAIGGLSPILVGYILQEYDITVAMTYLAVLYCVSFIVFLSIKKTKKAESVELKHAS